VGIIIVQINHKSSILKVGVKHLLAAIRQWTSKVCQGRLPNVFLNNFAEPKVYENVFVECVTEAYILGLDVVVDDFKVV